MRVNVYETARNEAAFIELTAETQEEALLLLRIGKNVKPDKVSVVTMFENGRKELETSIRFEQYKDRSTQVRNGRQK